LHGQKFDITLFSMERGLPSFFVKSIVQDSAGHIWIGTDNGLARYDGYDIKLAPFRPYSPYVKQLRRARDGSVWVVSDGGLQKILADPGLPLALSLQNRLVSTDYLTDSTLHFPRDVMEDTQGRLWISEPNAIVLVENGVLSRFELDRKHHSVGYHLAPRVHEMPDGTLFVLSETGYLLQFDASSRKMTEVIPELPHPMFNAQISVVRNDTLFVGGETGVYRLDLSGSERWVQEIDIRGVMGMLWHNDRLLVGTRHEGVYEFDRIPSARKPTGRKITGTETSGLKCLFTDRENNVWIASDQGIMLLVPSLFGSLFFDNGFPYTQSLRLNRNGEILTSNERAVYKLNPSAGAPEKWSMTKLFALEENNSILSVAGTEKSFYIGMADGRLYHISGGGKSEVKIPDTETGAAEKIFFINKDLDDNLWVLRDQRAAVLRVSKSGEIREFSADQGILSQPLSVRASTDGTVWVTAMGDTSFLYRFDVQRNRFINEARFHGLDKIIPEATAVHDLAFGPIGEVYLAGNQGVIAFTGGSFMRLEGFKVDNPSHLRSIATDNDGGLWIGAENGLYLWKDDAQYVFGVTDGLPGSTCLYRRLICDHSGTIWVGTNTGLGFLSARFSYYQTTRKPVIDQVSSISPGYGITGTSIFESSSVTFSVTNLMIPGSRIRYQYRLPGVSDSWTELSPDRTFTTGLIPAGTYRFEVRAQKIGLGLSEPQVYTFLVRHYWYNTPFADALYVLGGAGVLTLLILFVYNRRETREIVSRLQGTERRLAAVIESSPIFLFVVDRGFRITRLTGHAVSSLPVDASTAEGKPVANWFSSEVHLQAIRQAFEGRETVFTYQIDEKIFEVKLTPMPSATGETVNIVGVGTDVTQRMRMEEELIRAKNQAESASRSKSVFLASMSHELRTPLNAILGFSQILNNEQELPAKYRNFVSIMYKSGEHLLHMINDILDLSKIEAGHMQLNKKTFLFPEFVDDIHRMFLIRATEKNLRLLTEKAPDLPAVVSMDENKVRQIMINLIGNAIKFTQEGEVRISLSVRGHMVVLQVSDTGEGISESDQKAIFEPFVQGSRSFKEGTGLGLAITKRLVELMDGAISLQSEPGMGSTFTVELPFEYGELGEVHFHDASSFRVTSVVAPKPPLVLVVDDILGNRALLSAFFAQVGIECVEAENGAEAVKAVRDKQPDLIMMDIVMPVMDGREALRQIREMPGLETMPVIAVTASGLDSARQELLQLGFNEYVRKPFQQMELVAAIEKVTHWRFIADTTFHEPEVQPGSTEVLEEFNALDPEIQEELQVCLEMTDLEGAFKLASKLPEFSSIRRIIEEAHEASNYRLLISLDESLNP
jgi:PAS domain S-box-containing protein